MNAKLYKRSSLNVILLIKTIILLLILTSAKEMGHHPRPTKVTKHFFNNLF